MIESFNIGTISIPGIYIVLLLSLLVSYLMLWEAEYKKELFNEWTNALIMVFLIHKGTYILFSWSEFLNNPLGVFYFDGGPIGLLIAMVVAFIYMFYRMKTLFHAEAYAIFIVAFYTFYGLLELRAFGQWHYIFLTVLSLAALIFIYFKWKRIRVILGTAVTLLVLQLIVRFFIYNGAEIFNLSLLQWLIVLSIIYLSVTVNRGGEDEEI
ncbi:hypothetical protein GCM10022378_18890 [Salinicoccus jeotgali]|uniref:Prolipoprotein diacylglyceryl transferase n=1 Tax=Salinicoccus jeotgali TaxID=381634 RepID=A0ABP7F3H8_9STAP